MADAQTLVNDANQATTGVEVSSIELQPPQSSIDVVNTSSNDLQSSVIIGTEAQDGQQNNEDESIEVVEEEPRESLLITKLPSDIHLLILTKYLYTWDAEAVRRSCKYFNNLLTADEFDKVRQGTIDSLFQMEKRSLKLYQDLILTTADQYEAPGLKVRCYMCFNLESENQFQPALISNGFCVGGPKATQRWCDDCGFNSGRFKAGRLHDIGISHASRTPGLELSCQDCNRPESIRRLMWGCKECFVRVEAKIIEENQQRALANTNAIGRLGLRLCPQRYDGTFGHANFWSVSEVLFGGSWNHIAKYLRRFWRRYVSLRKAFNRCIDKYAKMPVRRCWRLDPFAVQDLSQPSPPKTIPDFIRTLISEPIRAYGVSPIRTLLRLPSDPDGGQYRCRCRRCRESSWRALRILSKISVALQAFFTTRDLEEYDVNRGERSHYSINKESSWPPTRHGDKNWADVIRKQMDVKCSDCWMPFYDWTYRCRMSEFGNWEICQKCEEYEDWHTRKRAEKKERGAPPDILEIDDEEDVGLGGLFELGEEAVAIEG